MLGILSKIVYILTLTPFDDGKFEGGKWERENRYGIHEKEEADRLRNSLFSMSMDRTDSNSDFSSVSVSDSNWTNMVDLLYKRGARGGIGMGNRQKKSDDFNFGWLSDSKFQRAVLLLIPSVKSFLVWELLVTLEEKWIVYQLITYATWFTNALAVVDYLLDFSDSSFLSLVGDWMTVVVWTEFFVELSLVIGVLSLCGAYTVYFVFYKQRSAFRNQASWMWLLMAMTRIGLE